MLNRKQKKENTDHSKECRAKTKLSKEALLKDIAEDWRKALSFYELPLVQKLFPSDLQSVLLLEQQSAEKSELKEFIDCFEYELLSNTCTQLNLLNKLNYFRGKECEEIQKILNGKSQARSLQKRWRRQMVQVLDI